MAKIQAYSSVSVVDLTDVGVINLYCTSNQPTSVIYDPDQNSYTPNWSTSNLVIAPVISYNGRTIQPNAVGVQVTYQRKQGSNTASNLTTGETVTGGILTVASNKIQNVSSGLLTYICTVTYTDPSVGVPVSAQTSLTYTLLKQASKVRAAFISGESAFLYDSSRNLMGSSDIVLTAKLTNVTVSQWQYQQSDGTFAAYPITQNINSSNSSNTLVVSALEENIWINGKVATIRLLTSDNNVTDKHTIVKIYDGVAGNSTIAAVLSNESFYLPCNADGTVRSGAWDAAATNITIYEGGSDVTSSWTINVANSSGLTGTYSNGTYTPTALTTDVGTATFTCTKAGNSPITKTYTISKLQAGADAVIYELESDFNIINIDNSGNLTPSSVTFTAYTKTGSSQVKSLYSGRFIISISSNQGTTFSQVYTSNTDEQSVTYQPSSSDIDIIKCTLYKSGGTTVALDSQSIVTVRDGQPGLDGQDGQPSFSAGLSNYSDVIPCDSNGNALAARSISIPYFAYRGITRVPVIATVGTLPGNISISSNAQGTTNTNGQLILSIAAGETFGNSSLMGGEITITLTNVQDAEYTFSFVQKYSWTKSKQAINGTNGTNGIDGQNAVILQLYSEDGGYVKNGKNSTIIKTRLISGQGEVTPTSVSWYKFNNTVYEEIQNQANSTVIDSNNPGQIQIFANAVINQMWLKCIAVYNNHNYEAYYTINDTSDECVAYTFATIQEFKNSQGFGAIYTRVYQNGLEIDPIKSTVFSDTAPTNPSDGDFYYHLDSTTVGIANNQRCILKKYNGTTQQWDNATQTDNLTYKYYRMDKNGHPMDSSGPYSVNRCFYIDPSIIDGRMQFICEVSNDSSN